MRLNLSFKFFISFLATSITIVIVMVVTMHYFAYRNFSDYIQKVEAIRLSELTPVLSREYRDSKGWDLLRDNPERWHELLRPYNSAAYVEKPPSMPSGFKSDVMPLPPPPPRERRGEELPDWRGGFAEGDVLRDRQGRRPPPDGPDADRRPPPEFRDGNPERPAFGIEHRLTLFDVQKEPVVGRFGSTEGNVLQEITLNGKTVGWLGLRNEDSLSNPLDMAFIKQQARAFYFVGVLSLFLAAVVAYLLSRHLLAPVQQLIQGARSLIIPQVRYPD